MIRTTLGKFFDVSPTFTPIGGGDPLLFFIFPNTKKGIV